MHIEESFRASPYISLYTLHIWCDWHFFALQVFKMRRSAIKWLAKDHWPFVACPSFPWRWSDCFSLRGWWLSFPLISSVSSSPITQTPRDGGDEAENTAYLDRYWRILWLKFQKSETWSDFWNMKHETCAYCFEPLAATKPNPTSNGRRWLPWTSSQTWMW